jgi:hypothetical protein
MKAPGGALNEREARPLVLNRLIVEDEEPIAQALAFVVEDTG